ncbi:MAG: hypothetical protein ACOCV4_08360 [Myxococcota bacterium]
MKAKSTKSPGKPPRGPTVRAPDGADELKLRLGRLATARGRIKTLRRSLQNNFLEIGSLLSEIEDGRLHEAKGYGSFEAFLEREVDLGVQLGLRLLRIARTFHPEAAQQAGLERSAAALDVLRGEQEATGTSGPAPNARSALPPHKR